MPQSKEEFCDRINNEESILDLSTDSMNLISFKNQGGLFNGGVCWWHTRFQRNSLYTVILRPELPRLKSQSDIKKVIRSIREAKTMTVIPGYTSFNEFTTTHKEDILNELENWQLYDGVVLGSWVDGLKGDISVKPERLAEMMDKLFHYVSVEKKMAYEKLQIKGITAHAWLIVGMKKSTNGYEIGLIDSNNPMAIENYTYKYGESSFYDKSYGNFVPYTEFIREEDRLRLVSKNYCLNNFTPLDESQYQIQYNEDLEDAKREREF
jgi:hypothetical protein